MSDKNSGKISPEAKELKALQAQVRGMEILLQQNSELEKEIERLCLELDQATLGIQKKGFLHKYRDKEIYYASKWGLRYFVLQGNTLSYFGDDQEKRPRRTIDLSKCFVRKEGMKKGSLYHVFSIYLGVNTDNPEEGSLLLRLSTDSAAECSLWVDMLEQACAIGDEPHSLAESPVPQFMSTGSNEKKQAFFASDSGGDEWNHSHAPIDHDNTPLGSPKTPKLNVDTSPLSTNTEGLSTEMLTRVRSSSLMLQRSMSRTLVTQRPGSLKRNNGVNYTRSGHKLDELSVKAAATAADVQEKLQANTKKHSHLPQSFPAFKPMHLHAAASPLSSEAPSGMHNYRGFFNLGIIILVLTHLDLIVNNMTKYGLKVALPAMKWTSTAAATVLLKQGGSYWLLDIMHARVLEYLIPLGWLAFWVFVVILNLLKEKLASRNLFTERFILCTNFLINTLVISLPVYWIWTSTESTPAGNMLYLFQSTIIWMKMVSYSHANKDLRVTIRRAKKADLTSSPSTESLDNNAKPIHNMQQQLSEVKDLQPPFLLYPQNLTLKNIAWFSIVPTLCYQLNYPRSAKIRWSHVAMTIFRLICVGVMVVFAVEQYMKPTLETAVQPMHDMNILAILERLLKLSIPSTYVWLLGFYWYFHLWLNLLAELTRFGDRQFYKDWWNAKTIDRYWRTWNMPVHHWITRHLYYPLIRAGASKITATFVVFAFSALLHEVIISVPFQHISLHAFTGMFLQAPLIWVTKYIDKRYDNAFVGNALFWCVFCIIGQPMGIIMYYYDMWKLGGVGL